ncbi:ribonuclease III [bacterium]|nr:ribonuclease III [bacterium]
MEQARHQLQQRLGYFFQQVDLLQRALRHESFANESEEGSQERLEFLGDSVVGLVICESLYRLYPDYAEGRLAQMKASLVSTEQLADKARLLELGQCVELGRGEQEGSRQRPNLLADTFEAVLGAIYLEAGFDQAKAVILRQFEEELRAAGELRRDYKSLLQEVSQRDFQALPEYEVLEEIGPPHDRVFRVQVSLSGDVLGLGQGRSKREASQQAAQEALSQLDANATLS